jgi:DNA polymerase III subunit gamma/tau
MTVSWYRKWRPKTFSDVIGQDHIISNLRHSIEKGRIGHAYLFTGPRGVGKTTTARLLAKSVNCTDSTKQICFDPCGKCALCKSFESESMVDVIEIDAASNRGIDDVRALRETIAFSPTTGKYKIYIIDEVHMLTKEAFNALLKTLEEPPSHVILILATTEVQKVPETILSRCQRFDFRPITKELLKQHILSISKDEKIELSDEGAGLIAEYSYGSGRDAISLLQQLSVDEGVIDVEKVKGMLGILAENEIDSILNYAIDGKIDEGLKIINDSISSGIDAELLAKMVLRVLSKSIKGNYESDWSKLTQIEHKISISDSWAWALQQIKSHPEPFLVLATAFLETKAVIFGTSSVEKGNMLVVPEIEKVSAPVLVQTEKPIKAEEKDDLHTLATVSWKPNDGEKALWQKLIEAAKPFNHSLSTLLQDSKLLSFSSGNPGTVNIGVNFPFHKNIIMDIKNRRVLEDLLKKITGDTFMLKCSLLASKDESTNQTHDDDLAKAAAEVFTE